MHFQLGLLLLEDQNFQEAQSEFGEAFRLNPNDPKAGEYALRDWSIVHAFEQKRQEVKEALFRSASAVSRGRLVPLSPKGEDPFGPEKVIEGDAVYLGSSFAGQFRPGKAKAVALLVDFAEYRKGLLGQKSAKKYLALAEKFLLQNAPSLKALVFYNVGDIQQAIALLKSRIHLFKGRPVIALTGPLSLPDEALVPIRLEREDASVTVSIQPSTAGLEEPLPAGAEEADRKGEPAERKPDPVVEHLLYRKQRARRRWIGYQRLRARQAAMQEAIGKYRAPTPLGADMPFKPAGNPRFRFSPRQWPDFMGISLDALKQDGIARIPLKGGEAVLLRRLHPDGKFLLLDLFLKPDGAPPIGGGRIDLSYEMLRGFVAKGRGGMDILFSKEAALYLQEAGISRVAVILLLDKSRYGEERNSALHVSQEAADALGVPLEVLQSMMTLVAVELLGDLSHSATFKVDPSYDNPFLAALASSALADAWRSPGTLVVAPLGNVRAVLRNRLSNASSGLEEKKEPVSEAELQEAKLRVRYALSLLTAESALQWQVAGMSVVARYPAVEFLDRYLLHFQIDPGGVGSELLAESLRLQHPPAEHAVYYGLPEEFNHFKIFSERRGIFPGEKPIEPGTLAFDVFLKQMLSNLTGLPEEDLFHRLLEINYPLSRLAADLELIGQA